MVGLCLTMDSSYIAIASMFRIMTNYGSLSFVIATTTSSQAILAKTRLSSLSHLNTIGPNFGYQFGNMFSHALLVAETSHVVTNLMARFNLCP